jgi:hypothetical protein
MIMSAQGGGRTVSARIAEDSQSLEFYEEGYFPRVILRVPLPGTVGARPLILNNLPPSDPHVIGQVWSNGGVLMVSAG